MENPFCNEIDLILNFVLIFADGDATVKQYIDMATVTSAESEVKSKKAPTNGLPVIGSAFSLSAAMTKNVSNIVLTTKPLGYSTDKSPPMETDDQPSNAKDTETSVINSPNDQTESTADKVEPMDVPVAEIVVDSTEISPKEVANEAPNSIPMTEPITPSIPEPERQPDETNNPPTSQSSAVAMDDEVEIETYEMLDVIDNESEIETEIETSQPESEIDTPSTESVDETLRAVAENGSGPSLKIAKVFQSVTDRLFDEITTNRKDKIRATKMMKRLSANTTAHNVPAKTVAKKSTSNVQKYRLTLKTGGLKNIDKYIRPGMAKTSQPALINSGRYVPLEEDEWIEVIEVPESELDNAVQKECNNAVEANNVAIVDLRNAHFTDYRCNICVRQNKNFIELKKHLLDTHQLPYVCRDCHGAFGLDQDYQVHMTNGGCTEKLNMYREYITLLDQPIRESQILVNVNKKDESFFCRYCSLKCADLAQYCAHAQRHARIFTCKICSRECFRTEAGMAHHLAHGTHRIEVVPRLRKIFDKNGLYMSTELKVHTNYERRQKSRALKE